MTQGHERLADLDLGLELETGATRSLAPKLMLPLSVVGVFVLVYTPMLLGEVVFIRDATNLYLSVHAYLVERLRAGELPLWYPYEALGVPFVENAVTAVFHPLTWLSVLLGPIRGMWLAQLSSVLLAAVGAGLLARRLGAGSTGAAVAGVCFGGGGALVSMLNNQPFFIGMVAFPWMLIGVVGVVSALGSPGPGWKSRAFGYVALAAASLSWTVLAGDMQGAMVMGGSSLALGMAIAPAGHRWKVFSAVAAIGLLGALLSSAQLLPSLAAASEMKRSAGFDWSDAGQWSLHPLRLTEIFFGHQGGLGGPEQLSWLYPRMGQAWHISVFMGTLTLIGLVLAVPSVVRRDLRGRTVSVLLVLTVLCLWLALGRWGGLYRLLHEHLPLWGSFRYPEKLVSWAALPLALITAFGVSEGFRRPKRSAIVVLWLGGLAALCAIALALAGHHDAVVEGYLDQLTASLASGALLCVGVGLAFWLFSRRGAEAGRHLKVYVVLVALLDIAGTNGVVLELSTVDPVVLKAPSMVGDLLREEGRIERLGDDRITTITGDSRPWSLPADARPPGALTIEHMLWSRNTLDMGHAAYQGFESTSHYLPATSRRFHAVGIESYPEWIGFEAGLFSSRYLILNSDRADSMSFPGTVEVARHPDRGYVVLERLGALPRVFVAEPMMGGGPEEAREALRLPAVRAGRKAFVEATGAASFEVHEAASFEGGGEAASFEVGGEAAPGRARIVSYRPERVEVVAELVRPGVLVLNDAHWPGWRVRVNDEKAEIHRANYLVRGVLLDAGRHEVIFEYPPPPALILGMALSLTAGAACLLVLVSSWRRRSRSGGRTPIGPQG